MLNVRSIWRQVMVVALTVSASMATNADAQSAIGKWEGNAYAGTNTIPIVITLDSTATGWTGTFLASMLRADAINIATVTMNKDTVSILLPAEGMGALLQGVISADRKSLNGQLTVQGNNSGTFAVSKVVPPSKPPLASKW